MKPGTSEPSGQVANAIPGADSLVRQAFERQPPAVLDGDR